tara:strand:+ start:221 stop:865 length:645 start_codon:yes stop_codon:yes gene_type:complete
MDVENDAEIIVGFENDVIEEEYVSSLDNGKVLDILISEKIDIGNTFYIPTGRVHAIGAGTVLAEIQQTSDITYRIYDYDRVDVSTGVKRDLHTDLALKAIDYKDYDDYRTKYNLKINESSLLVHSPYFKTNIIQLNDNLAKDYLELDSFVIYICVEGQLTLKTKNNHVNLVKGETILVPASISNVELVSKNAKLTEVYMQLNNIFCSFKIFSKF